MKNYIIIILVLGTLQCKAQLLQPKPAQIELMNGNTKKAVLYSYTNDAIIVNRIAYNNTNGQIDTISYINIARIKVAKKNNKYIFTPSLLCAGLIIGGIVGHASEPAPTPGSIINTTGLTTIISAFIGGCIGASIGFLADLGDRNYIFTIYATEARFKEFIDIYKSDGVIKE